MASSPYEFRFRALGGENELRFYASHELQARIVANAIIDEVNRIEKKFSRYLPDSILSQINAAAGNSSISVDEETAALLDYADACFRQSDGLFDITSGVLRRVWNFRERKLPSAAAIKSVLPQIGWRKVKWKRPEVYLSQSDMELDFGGIGKEYAVDRAVGIFAKHKIAHGLVNFAGDIRVCGPHPSGMPWSVAIADPNSAGGILGAIDVSQGAVATSGDYERRIEINGQRYSHILNPRTGWPTSGPQSVSVLAPSCLIAGSITTTAMLLEDKAEEYLREIGMPYVLVTRKGAIKSGREFQSSFAKGITVNRGKGCELVL